MSSILHALASTCLRARLFIVWNNFASKPVERSAITSGMRGLRDDKPSSLNSPTPSQRYPGRILNRFGGAGGPVYFGLWGPLDLRFCEGRGVRSECGANVRRLGTYGQECRGWIIRPLDGSQLVVHFLVIGISAHATPRMTV